MRREKLGGDPYIEGKPETSRVRFLVASEFLLISFRVPEYPFKSIKIENVLKRKIIPEYPDLFLLNSEHIPTMVYYAP